MHNLVTELIKATGLELKDPEKYKITHTNTSHSTEEDDKEVYDNVVFKVVLQKKIQK